MASLDSNSIDATIIDPPYGIDKLNETWDINEIKKSTKKSGTIGSIPVGMKFDKTSAINISEFLLPHFSEILRILKPGGFLLVFSQARSSHRIGVALEDAGLELRDQLQWNYGSGQGKAQSMNNFINKNKKFTEKEKEKYKILCEGMKTPQLTPTFETIWLAQKPKEGTFVENYIKYGVGLVNFKDGSKRVQFNHKKPGKAERADGQHPTQKPVALLEDLVKIFSPEFGTVLDCFCGSGTSGVASIRLNRNYIGVDFDNNFCNISKTRLINELQFKKILDEK